MGKTNGRLDSTRTAYREALEAARANPTPEAWAKLLAAGKELSAAHDPKTRSTRRGRKTATPSLHELEGPPPEAEPRELDQIE